MWKPFFILAGAAAVVLADNPGLYEQCGGVGYHGSIRCEGDIALVCTYITPEFSLCLPDASSTTTRTPTADPTVTTRTPTATAKVN
ncbi:hypothetical protein CPB83DRAFT_653610 [Crepidotus variabilis]|uniref:CBM1 domain-containing protein n=1 Tax=Crepidotus variabilis TaxID=179855 RepID=A0A9P6JKB1_9AGAR|nr:hypothetical protein CPB83DRAFT_653610 [Crepidotus variabilis]